MPASAQFAPAAFSLGAVVCWGISDFLGGFGARRANVFLMTAITHLSGLVVVLALALATHAPVPTFAAARWGFLAGSCGGTALALFYRALSTGKMGLTAPVAAVFGAALPALVGMASDGLPGRPVLAGFFLAALGLWLIASPEEGTGLAGIGTAVVAGTGFGLFYVFVHQMGDSSALWSAVISRVGALTMMTGIVLIGRHFKPMNLGSAILASITGILDVTGTVVFIRASQLGRLDAAVVLSSLYPAVTVLLAHFFLREKFSSWKAVGLTAALLAVPLIAMR